MPPKAVVAARLPLTKTSQDHVNLTNWKTTTTAADATGVMRSVGIVQV